MPTWWRRGRPSAIPAHEPVNDQPPIAPLARRPARPTAELEDAIGLWEAGRAVSEEIVDAAVTALVAGADSPSLRELAGMQARFAAMDAPPLVPAVVRELDLHPTDPELALEHRARDLLEHCAADPTVTPREMVRRVDALLEREFWTGDVAALRYANEEYGLLDEGLLQLTEIELDTRVRALAAALITDPAV